MNREIHVRICGRLGVQLPGPTRPFENVAMAEMRTQLAIERAGLVTLHLQPARRSSIPTIDKWTVQSSLSRSFRRSVYARRPEPKSKEPGNRVKSNRIAAGEAKAQPNSHREAKATAPVLDSTLHITQYKKAPTFAVSCESLQNHTYRKGAPL